MPMKANKFGIKVWVLPDDKNFLLSWFQITLVNKLNKKVWDTILFGLSVNHIWTNADIFSRLFFTSANLMRDLELRGTYSCSTVHTDRRDYPAELKHAKLVPGEIRTHQCRIWWLQCEGTNMLYLSNQQTLLWSPRSRLYSRLCEKEESELSPQT